jgi:hypothetical protein
MLYNYSKKKADQVIYMNLKIFWSLFKRFGLFYDKAVKESKCETWYSQQWLWVESSGVWNRVVC